VFKSGPLFLSSKGIGWTTWKKRWFVLTRTSLVFFRSDPSAVPQKGSEVNLTLGGIDLNNSGSVVVKADKKLLTVLFPDGRDGRAYTLKAETLEDLHEWKAALEEALEQAPSGTFLMGQNGAVNDDQTDPADDSTEQSKDKNPVKSIVIGRPILLALEDIDGTPSFLEKALRFVEEHGVKTEGILRQAADVEDVERRIQEYEQGKTDFSAEEDGHVIGDCIKYVIRELPSSPVPASCCKALLEACRTDRSRRVDAMREAICETFPEPNRRLLQRILQMMQIVASHKAVNRMSSSAVAACMAPLLLRPLLAGECELENDFDVGGDGSMQLLQAAAAANHAQAIVITLLEEYENIFGLFQESLSSGCYSESEESGSESGELTEDDESGEYDEDEDGTEGLDSDMDEDFEQSSNETQSDTGDIRNDDKANFEMQGSDGQSLVYKSHQSDDDCRTNQKSSTCSAQSSSIKHDYSQSSKILANQKDNRSGRQSNNPDEISEGHTMEKNLAHELPEKGPPLGIQKSATMEKEPVPGRRHTAVWGRAHAKRIAELQAILGRQTNTSHKRYVALRQEVARLQEQLESERELRTVLEAGLKMPHGNLHLPASIDGQTRAELEEIAQVEADVMNLKQKADALQLQLNQLQEQSHRFAKLKEKEKEKESELAANLHDPERSIRNKTQLLKEPCSQIASVLQILEKGWGSGSIDQSVNNRDIGVATESKSFQSTQGESQKAILLFIFQMMRSSLLFQSCFLRFPPAYLSNNYVEIDQCQEDELYF
ncbi:hypothetical protein NMG60_11016701, partial [Bertholletia excelsa]